MLARTLLAGVILTTAPAFTQPSHRIVTTVFYFGGSDCPYSVDPKNIDNLKTMKTELPKKYQGLSFKFVLVVMDEDIQAGIEFAKKYGSWDEVSIGEFYNNELMLQHVNRSHTPGVPHIMVYRDSLVVGKYNIPTIGERTLLVDLVGEGAIGKWVQDEYPLIK